MGSHFPVLYANKRIHHFLFAKTKYVVVFKWRRAAMHSTVHSLPERRRLHFPCLVCRKLKEEEEIKTIQTGSISWLFGLNGNQTACFVCTPSTRICFLPVLVGCCRTLKWRLCTAHILPLRRSRWCFSVAQDTCVHTARRMWPCMAQTTFRCGWLDLSVSWVHSHLYLELSTCDWITQDAC